MKNKDTENIFVNLATGSLDQKNIHLGPYSTYALLDDPRHLLFSIARYKFASKMLSGIHDVCEIGCGDAFGTHFLLQEIDLVHGVDINEKIIEYNTQNNQYPEKLSFDCWDVVIKPLNKKFDAVVSFDVIEHIPFEKEGIFLKNIALSMKEDGVVIVGTPNVTSAPYASKYSITEHINLKSHKELKQALKENFKNVFIFSMNDEVVHTGYSPMAHYLIALAVSPIHI